MTRPLFLVILVSAFLITPGRQASSGQESPASPTRPLGRTDSEGDPLPPAAVARLGSQRLYHGGSITSLAFLRDGETVLTVGDGVLRAWKTAGGKEVSLPIVLPCPTAAFAVSVNGKLFVASGSDRMIRVGDLQTGRILREWTAGESGSGFLAFSPDSQSVAWVEGSGKIHIHDLATDRDTRILTGHENAPYSVAFAPNGKTLASLSFREGIFYWDLATGKRIRRYSPTNERQVLAVSGGVHFTADGQSLLAIGNDSSIVAYDIDSIEERFRVDPPAALANALAVSPDGKTFATGSNDGSIRLWQMRTGKAVALFPAGPGARMISAIAFSPDGKTLAASMDATLHLCDVATGKEIQAGNAMGPFALAGFSTNGQEVISLQNGALVHWSLKTGKVVQQCKLTGGNITGAALSGDRELLAVARGDTPLAILDVRRGVERTRTTMSFRREVALMFTSDARYLAGIGAEEPNTIRVWNPLTGKDVLSLKGAGNDNTLFSLAMSRDGRTLFSVGQEEKALVRWELVSGQRRGCYLMPDPRPSLRNSGGHLVMWRGGGFRERIASRLPLVLSPDNRLLAVCRGEFLFLCDLREERVLHALIGPDKPFTSVAFSSNGRWLAAGAEDRQVRLYDVRSGQLRATLNGHRAGVLQVDFSPESDRLLSTSADGTVLVWDVAAALRLPAQAARSPDPRTLEALWTDMASEDAAVAEKAQRAFEDQAERALPFLARSIRPVRAVASARLEKLIVDLDSNELKTRDEASNQLDELGEQAVPSIRKASDSPSAEVRRRVQRLLDKRDRPTVTGLHARPIRVVELLERLGSPLARKLLAELAGGSADALLTREAQVALKRLGTAPREGSADRRKIPR